MPLRDISKLKLPGNKNFGKQRKVAEEEELR
jgi:hypothetical protein